MAGNEHDRGKVPDTGSQQDRGRQSQTQQPRPTWGEQTPDKDKQEPWVAVARAATAMGNARTTDRDLARIEK